MTVYNYSKGDDAMGERTKALLSLALWIVVLAVIIVSPAVSVFVLAALAAGWIYKKVTGKPVIRIRKRRK